MQFKLKIPEGLWRVSTIEDTLVNHFEVLVMFNNCLQRNYVCDSKSQMEETFAIIKNSLEDVMRVLLVPHVSARVK